LGLSDDEEDEDDKSEAFNDATSSPVETQDQQKTIEELMVKENEVWKCKVCGRITPHLQSLRTHLELHVRGLYNTCDLCMKVFPTKSLLASHKHDKHIQNEERLGKDKEISDFIKKEISPSSKNVRRCKKIVTVRDMSEVDAKIEQLYERRDGRYHCLSCQYSSLNRAHLKEHVEKHIEGLLYPCQFCDKSFRSKNSFRGHIRIKHRTQDKISTMIFIS